MSAPPTLDRGTAIRITAEIRDAAGLLTDPATITTQIVGPTGTTYLAQTQMTNSSVGIFILDRQIGESDPTGMYEIIIRATSASLTSLLRENGFMLE